MKLRDDTSIQLRYVLELSGQGGKQVRFDRVELQAAIISPASVAMVARENSTRLTKRFFLSEPYTRSTPMDSSASLPTGEVKKKKKKKKTQPIFVDLSYPTSLGIASLAWAVGAWIIAAFTPQLAFLPFIGFLNVIMPVLTVLLISANLFFAVRDLFRGVHILRLLIVTTLQVALFTTLFFQLYMHIGSYLYQVDGPTEPWQWFGFSFAHVLRASDALDMIEAFSMKTQAIKHASALVAIFVIIYHIVVDIFFLGLVFDLVGRFRDRLLEDEGIKDLLIKLACFAFGLWFLTWIAFAVFISPWRLVDFPLWYVENVLRVVDFADVMESFDLRLHSIPREGVTGALTFLCRFWIGLAVAFAVNSGPKNSKQPKKLVMPADEQAGRFWQRRIVMFGGVSLCMILTAVVTNKLVGDPVPRLTREVSNQTDRAPAALAGLRRMGPSASSAIPGLVEAVSQLNGEQQREVILTLGYLGPLATQPLYELSMKAEEIATVAVQSLGRIGESSAMKLVQVWEGSPSSTVKQLAEEQLIGMGPDAVDDLMSGVTVENSEAVYQFLPKMDPNWRLRSTNNSVMVNLQQLPDLIKELQEDREINPDFEVYKKIQSCGTAGNVCTPILIDRLNWSKARNDAVVALQAIGKRATPEILKRLESNANLGGAVPRLLGAPNMWDADLARTPSGLKQLQRLVSDNMSLAPVLVLAGTAARDSVPDLVVLLASSAESERAKGIGYLEAIDPKWRENPKLSRAIPKVLTSVGSLPDDVATSFVALLGPAKPEEGDAIASAILQAGPRDKQDTEKVKMITKGVQRFGKNLDAAAPALDRILKAPNTGGYIYSYYVELSKMLLVIAKDPAPYLPTIVKFAEHDQDGLLPRLKAAGPSALPLLVKGYRDAVRVKERSGVLEILREMGPAAKSVATELRATLGNQFVLEQIPPTNQIVLVELFKTLDGIDPEWIKAPMVSESMLKLLLEMQAKSKDTGLYTDVTPSVVRPQLHQVIVGMTSRLPDLGRYLLREFMKQDRIDPAVAPLLDKLQAGWRADPEILAMVPELFSKFVPKDPSSCRSVAMLGVAALSELEKLYRKADPIGRGKILIWLKELGAAAKPMIPTLIASMTSDAIYNDGKYNEIRFSQSDVAATLGAIDPKWAEAPTLKPVIPEMLNKLFKPNGDNRAFYNLVAAFGPAAVPTLETYLKSKEASQQIVGLMALAIIGPAAKSAMPRILELAKSKDFNVQMRAIEAAGRILKNDPKVVSTLLPLLTDPDPRMPALVANALNTSEPNWRFDPAVSPLITRLAKDLESKELPPRVAALAILEQIGSFASVVKAVKAMNQQQLDYDSHQRRSRLLSGMEPVRK
jgi:hypothetical protein